MARAAVSGRAGWVEYRAMLGVLGGMLWETPGWRLLIGFWGSLFAGATATALTRGRGGGKARRQEKGKNGERKPRVSASVFAEQFNKLFRIAFPTLLGKEAAHLMAYSVLLTGRVVLGIIITDIGAQGVKCLTSMKWRMLFKYQLSYMSLCVPIAGCNAMMRYEQNKLAMSMRARLVRHVHDAYLDSRSTFYRMHSLGQGLVSTLDQRCTSDLEGFADGTASLYGDLLKPTVEILMYSRKIAAVIGRPQLFVFLAYFAFASNWLKFVMPSFGKLTARSAELEGNFRSSHARVLAHAEEIAFYGGGERERQQADRAFGNIIALKKKTLRQRAVMSFLDTTFVKHFGGWISYLIMIPTMYLDREGVNVDTDADRTAFFISCLQYFHVLATAINTLYQNSYQGLTKLAGMSDRLCGLIDELDRRGGSERSGGVDREGERIVLEAQRHASHSGVAPRVVERSLSAGEEATLSLSHVDIFSPDGTLLIKDLNMTVAPGQHLIIEGPNGAGKSSLLRTIGALWPLCGGTLHKPPREQLGYVPQRPYLCKGTLCDQLTYPDVIEGPTSPELGDALQKIMVQVGLGQMVQREGGWDAERDWHEIFSGGEKQRVAMARLLHHGPAFAVLDEATAAVSHDIEEALVTACHRRGITLISVSHRAPLRAYHMQCLKLLGDGKGGWELLDISADCKLRPHGV